MELREYIQFKKIKQIALAKMIGIDSARLSRFLHGWDKLPIRYLAPFCGALGIEKNDLAQFNVKIGEQHFSTG